MNEEKPKLTIAQAFKLKNKMVQEITNLKIKIRKNNSFRVGAVVHYDAAALYTELATRKADLVILKAAIIKANLPVYQKIYMLSEFKDQIQLLKSLDTTEGKQIYGGRLGQQTEEEYKAVINQPTVDSNIVTLEEKIEKIQEELDQWNHSTVIDLS